MSGGKTMLGPHPPARDRDGAAATKEVGAYPIPPMGVHLAYASCEEPRATVEQRKRYWVEVVSVLEAFRTGESVAVG